MTDSLNVIVTGIVVSFVGLLSVDEIETLGFTVSISTASASVKLA